MSMDMYREYILEHYRHPKNEGSLERPDISKRDENPLCGDEVQIDVTLDPAGRVKDIAFHGHGCAISQASTSIMTELAKGKTLEELKAWGHKEVVDWLGISLSPVRVKCAMLGLKVLQAGILEYEQRGEDRQP